MGLVAGKIALVTGSGAGIGRATAIRFAEEGAKVAVSDVNIDAGNETVALIKRIGGDAIFIRADVARAAEVKALIAGIVDTYGRLDCACNNAASKARLFPSSTNQRTILIRLCLLMLKASFYA
jgi:NAD(P)-dependent dehydrogenase (short-subunit alcohol dehydrogenase family)